MENENLYTEHADREINKGCPQCGAAMIFDPADGKLFCPYCEYREEVAETGSVEEQAFDKAAHVESFSWGAQQKQVICQSCGAEGIYDALVTSAVCPFCGSNQVMEEAVDTSLPPNGLCPFEVTKEQAGANFKNWMKHRLFAPRKAKKSVQPDSFHGMYIPYWTFDANTETTYTAEYGIDETYTDDDGHTHTRTDWYTTSGAYNLFIDDMLTWGTARRDTTILRHIEPYDTAKCVPYNPEYLSGYVSERYSIGVQEAWTSAQKRMDAQIESEICRMVTKEYGADHCRLSKKKTQYNDLTYKYILVSLWQSSFSYQNKPYQFMVNGQTGKVGGKSPVSPLRVLAAVLLALAALGLIFWLCSGSDLELSVFRFDACSHGIALDASCSADIPVETVILQSPVLHTAAMTCAP